MNIVAAWRHAELIVDRLFFRLWGMFQIQRKRGEAVTILGPSIPPCSHDSRNSMSQYSTSK